MLNVISRSRLKGALCLAAMSLTFASCRTTNASSDLDAAGSPKTIATDEIVKNVKVTPVNGGISPLARGYLVEGKVMLGSNKCRAADGVASLVQSMGRGGIIITPTVTKSAAGAGVICKADFDPVYADASTRVMTDDKTKVWINNVDTRDNNVNIDTIKSAAPDCDELKKASSGACCAAMTPSCIECGDKVRAAAKEYKEQCSDDLSKRTCDELRTLKNGACCMAMSPSCLECKSKLGKAAAMYRTKLCKP